MEQTKEEKFCNTGSTDLIDKSCLDDAIDTSNEHKCETKERDPEYYNRQMRRDFNKAGKFKNCSKPKKRKKRQTKKK